MVVNIHCKQAFTATITMVILRSGQRSKVVNIHCKQAFTATITMVILRTQDRKLYVIFSQVRDLDISKNVALIKFILVYM